MGEKKSLVKAVLGAAALLGTTLAVAKTWNEAKKEEKEEFEKKLKPFDELLKTQDSIDVFGSMDAKKWFVEQSGGNTAGKEMVIGYLKKGLAEKLGYEGTEELDPEHYLLQVLRKERGKEVLALRLVNFTRLEERFKTWIEEQDGVAFLRG